jgi:acetyl esterase/lipase
MQSDDDETVSAMNSIHSYAALRAAGVPAELHVYRTGGHGCGLASLDVVLSSYSLRVADWLRGLGLLLEDHTTDSLGCNYEFLREPEK